VSTGDLLRAEAESGSEFGRELAAILAAGQYVSDEMVNQMIENRLDRLNGGGIILDGYPRTVAQARFLDRVLERRQLPPARAVHLLVPHDIIVRRLSSRSQCTNCRRVFNDHDHPAPYCAECGAPLIRRDDDKPEVVAQRLQTYQAKTGPVLAHYAGRGFCEVDGNQDPEIVLREILRVVGAGAMGGANGASG
jgi:adenylate kinase